MRYFMTRVNGVLKNKHVAIWEEATGRQLPPGHVIHHIDGNSKNNDPSNLQLMTRGEHTALHARLRKEGKDVVDPNDPDVIACRAALHNDYMRHRAVRTRKQREYNDTHREERRRASREYRTRNREECVAKDKAYYAANCEVVKRRNQAYRDARRDLVHAKDRLRSAYRYGMSESEIDKRKREVAKEQLWFDLPDYVKRVA